MQGRFKMQAVGYAPEVCELVRTASVFSSIQLDTPRGVAEVMGALQSVAHLDEPTTGYLTSSLWIRLSTFTRGMKTTRLA
jgi:hypothetical protein